MTTIQPDGEQIRKAVKWISEEKQDRPGRTRHELLEAAGLRFNLSPLEMEFVGKLLGDKQK